MPESNGRIGTELDPKPTTQHDNDKTTAALHHWAKQHHIPDTDRQTVWNMLFQPIRQKQ